MVRRSSWRQSQPLNYFVVMYVLRSIIMYEEGVRMRSFAGGSLDTGRFAAGLLEQS
jgi:hypothetical protein